MKKLIILFLGLYTSLLFAGAYLQSYVVKSDGTNVVIEWQTGAETNLKEFVVLRKTINGVYDENGIAKIPAKGSNSSYKYEDKAAFKSNGTLYTYKLKFVDNSPNGSVVNGYSQEISVSHNVSGVKRTWASIKALFR